MENIQSVKLISSSDLNLVDRAIGTCYDKGEYKDAEAKMDRIQRVCNSFRHSSMLRFVTYTFDVVLSTSALLEWTRHQVGVDYAVRSTRYVLKKNIESLSYIPSRDESVNTLLNKIFNMVKDFIKENPKLKNDDLKLLLPQAYSYRMTVQFNGQSLQHFLELRSSKKAHFHIRELAVKLYEALPEEHKQIYKDSVTLEA